MTKNAITVIDQERIDLFKELASKAEYCITLNLNIFNDFISEHESLIEINAELTKREQKLKSFVDRISDKYIDTFSIDELAEVDCLLKGDSDE